MKYPIPPGVFDIIPTDHHEAWKSSYLWTFVEEIIRDTARDYGYQEIRTPLFERTELFQRSVGDTSDIVSKEMYTFEDKGGRSLSLRPEGTAPVMRAFIEHHLDQAAPIHKFFYIASMFRYERAQAGRYRQHHQFGAEAIGNATPEQDAEMIDLLYTLYQRLGLKNLTLFINSIGDTTSRQAFRHALKEYLTPQFSLLSPDSQTRFEFNPLRILDSKDPRDRDIVAHAPSILDFLNDDERAHFEDLKRMLDLLRIPYQINPLLVRGLDYYNKTVFEVVAGELGAQNSIGGGGRYDGLLQILGGPDLPSIGFGTGIERILQTMINQNISLPHPEHPTLFLIPLGEKAKSTCFEILHTLREQGIPSQMDFSGKKVGKILQYANQIGATYVVVIGDHELESQEIELKEMATGHKVKISLAALVATLKLEAKGDLFAQLWNELSQPFESQNQANLLLNKLKTSLTKAQESTDHVVHHLEKIKKIVEESYDV
jgi:histidyl-tRNA synthetase